MLMQLPDVQDVLGTADIVTRSLDEERGFVLGTIVCRDAVFDQNVVVVAVRCLAIRRLDAAWRLLSYHDDGLDLIVAKNLVQVRVDESAGPVLGDDGFTFARLATRAELGSPGVLEEPLGLARDR